MSDQIRQPSAVTLSAQNLAFSPQGFVGGGQVGNIPVQFPGPMVGQHGGIPMTGDMMRQAQKMREYEHQRAKLQQMNARGTSSTANPDAMIAQMLGKPLTPNAPASASANRRPAPPQGSSFMYVNQANYPSSAPPYVGAIPSAAPVPGMETSRHPAPSNRPSMAPFMLPEARSAVPPSALHLTPKDLEKMMHHFAGMRLENGKFPASAMPEFSHPGFKPATTMDGVFVIPTMPSPMIGADGHPIGASMASPIFFMPPWTRDKSKLPEEYLKLLNACLPPNRPYGGDLPDTGLVYVLLRTSGLSNEILGTIWALVNRSQPGQLIKEEFFAALALVAVAQETGTVASFESLTNMARPPIPRLSLSALNVPPSPAPYSAPQPPNVSSMNSSLATPVERRPSNGLIEPSPAPIIGVQAPANSALATSSSAVPNDDFGEFTDFQAAATLTPLTAVKDTPTPTLGQDPYAALRSLAPVEKPVDDVMVPDKTMAPPRTVGHGSAKPHGAADLASISSGKHGASDPAPLSATNHPGPAKSSSAKSQDDSFGDFAIALPTALSADRLGESAANQPQSIAMPMGRSRTDPKIASGFVDMASVQKKDLNELLRQTYESLDLGGGYAKSDDDAASVRSESKEPSIHSLDLQSLKQFDLEQQEAGETEVNHVQAMGATMRSPAGSISLVDRYAAFRENGEQNGESASEKHVDAWTKCLEACLQLLKQAESVFSRAEDESVRKEILATDRGSKYLCGNIQIYRVSRRIRLSLQTMAFQTDKLIDLLTDIEAAWSSLCSFVAFSGMLPKPENLDFRNALLPSSGPVDERRKGACCGVCLLNVDATCKTDQGTSFDYKLTYGGRQYHAQCANLWINCIDSVLPALDVPCLL